MQRSAVVLVQSAPHPDRLRPAEAQLELQALAARWAVGAQPGGQLAVRRTFSVPQGRVAVGDLPQTQPALGDLLGQHRVRHRGERVQFGRLALGALVPVARAALVGPAHDGPPLMRATSRATRRPRAIAATSTQAPVAAASAAICSTADAGIT